MRTRSVKVIVLAGISMVAALISCQPDPPVRPQEELAFTVPDGWPQPVYQFENNPLTAAGFALGKRLFFDQRLSRNNTISCGSCHQQFAAFSHLDHNVSHGIDDRLGTRNSPPIFNLNWHSSFFWDGGVNHIESQPINPIQNPVEMDETLPNVLAKLENDDRYKRMFTEVFGDPTINTQRLFKALAQYMGMLLSTDAPYDLYTRDKSYLFSPQELLGLDIFRSKCASCHTEPLFSDFSFRNNGLAPTVVNDSGRALITREEADLYKFKVPSLRNLKYTPPYMHDGRFKTLEEVLEHYATGIHISSTLDPLLIDGISLSGEEKTALLAFLNTLNDETFVKNPLYRQDIQ